MNYLLKGTEALDLSVCYQGTMHFIHHPIPEWYSLVSIGIDYTGTTLSFSPTSSLPESLRPQSACLIKLAPHEGLEVIAKKYDEKEKTSHYAIISCKQTRSGRSYFHFDTFRKNNVESDDDHIPLDITSNKLNFAGYQLIKSVDNPNGLFHVVFAD